MAKANTPDGVPGEVASEEAPTEDVVVQPAKKGTAKVKCVGLAGGELHTNDGIVQFDTSGVADVSIAEAERLLTIPGFEKA
jgi:hypothetical protein